jgi:all-trans-retinol dehydrogenase (NAD+)
MTTISNKHVLITGAASGIGRLLALRCAGLGATVTIWDLDAAGGEAAAAEATALGPGRALAFACDVSDRAQVYARAEEVRAQAGPVDVLVNNAGVVSGRELLELDDERIERTFAVNALAPFWVTRAFLPAMVAGGSGHVVTVASAAGLMGSPRMTDYSASKFAAVGFNEALRLELKRSAPGVKTTIVCPFYIDTGMFEGVKTRFPLLLPILCERDVVERILKAVQHDRPQVVMPWMVSTLPAMRLLPVAAFDRLAGFFGITVAMDEFTGRDGGARPS